MNEPKDDPNETIWRDLLLADGDDSAAREHLAVGFPVYYVEDDTPPSLLVKEHPDGRRELVRFDKTGDEVIKMLAKCSPYDTADYLKTEDDIAIYLTAAMEDGDPVLVEATRDDAARARARIAAMTGTKGKGEL